MAKILSLLLTPTLETLYMVSMSSVFALILGAPLGILLTLTEKGGLKENPALYRALDSLINVLRSFPFIILMIVLFPLSRLIVGTTIGTTATIVPLSIAAAPFAARVVQSSLKEVDKGVVEAALAMGSDSFTIVRKVLIPEARPALVSGITLTVINIVSYSAMAGAIGGGGLGDLAIRYGFHRFRSDVLIAAVIVIVQGIQWIGNRIAASLSKNR
ncbi:MAG: methionine ABC transporter permease [Pyramidobacter sp.]|nr:methionine ABC transporter permease [Pyramidobacter sp.]